MKKFVGIFILCVALVFTGTAYAKKVSVKVSGGKGMSRFKANKTLEGLAREEAVKQYAKNKNRNILDKVLDELATESAQYVINSDCGDMESDDNGGFKMTCMVNINDLEIGRAITNKGVAAGAGYAAKLIILEDPPSKGRMGLLFEKGAAAKTRADIAQLYTDIQKNIKSVIMEKLKTVGFDAYDLEVDERFKDFMSADSHLVGVYFDVDKGDFKIDRELIAKIKQVYPDTLILYYRISSLYVDRNSINAGIALDIKSLKYNTATSLGQPLSFSSPLPADRESKNALIDGVKQAAGESISELMKTGRFKINELIEAANRGAENAPVVMEIESKSGRLLYEIKKTLIAKGTIKNADAETYGSTLKIVVQNKDIKDCEAFFYECIAPILDKNGVKVPEDFKPTGKTGHVKL